MLRPLVLSLFLANAATAWALAPSAREACCAEILQGKKHEEIAACRGHRAISVEECKSVMLNFSRVARSWTKKMPGRGLAILSPEDCLKQGGLWMKGEAEWKGLKGCNRKTGDAESPCKTTYDCEGSCTNGHCSAWWR